MDYGTPRYGTWWKAALLASEAKDTAAVNGTARWQAALAASEARDTALLSGIVSTGPEIVGSLNALEAPDTALINATVSGVVAALAATEARDIRPIDLAVRWQASLAASEASDTASFNGAVRWSAALGAVEAGQKLLSCHIQTSGDVHRERGGDTALVLGRGVYDGRDRGFAGRPGDAGQRQCSGTISGTVATLAAIEAPDTVTIVAR